MAERNWAGNVTYSARAVERPATVERLQDLVARTRRLRIVASRHSFTDLGDAPVLVSLDAIPPGIAVAADGRTVTVTAATRYGELAAALHEHGLALANLASLPHISVGGAIATATHGSGTQNLAAAVAALELVTSDGERRRVERGDPDFDGHPVHLGLLGAVTHVTLDVQPAYEVRQDVLLDVPWERLPELHGAAYSVSAFTYFAQDAIDQVWLKSRGERGPAIAGARRATAPCHPIRGEDPRNCSEQLGVPGPWWDRLPHFRMGFKPSAGAELQSEHHVPRERAAEAVEALRRLRDVLRPLTLVCELRTVAADRLWMSPQYERDTLGIHFTWRQDEPAVRRAVESLDEALRPLGSRPHLGKLLPCERPAALPRQADFLALATRLDPRGAFRNAWVERVLSPGS